MKKSLLIFLEILFLVLGTSKTTTAIEYTDSSPGMKIKYDTGARNGIRKLEFGLAAKQLSLRQIAHLKMLHSNWARKNAVEYWLNRTFLNMAAAPFSEALSQYKSPELVTTGLSAGIAGLQNVRSIGSAAKGVANAIPRTKDVLGHIFRDATGHVNHATVASQNRYIKLFESVANNSKNINANVLTNYQRTTGGFQGIPRHLEMVVKCGFKQEMVRLSTQE